MGKIILFGVLLVGLTSAGKGSVVLTTGESIEGHMLSADENTVRFRDTRGIVQEIPRDKNLDNPAADDSDGRDNEAVARHRSGAGEILHSGVRGS